MSMWPIALVTLVLVWRHFDPKASSLFVEGQASGQQQALAQQLQVFNGNASDAQQLEANHFKLLEIIDEDTLLVGARNVVYNLSLSTMREQRRLVWKSSEQDAKTCRMKGKSSEQCQNYIRVLKLIEPSVLLACGTNAYKPLCRKYAIVDDGYAFIEETSGEGVCPYQENQNVTSTLTDGQLYSATVAQFSGVDGLIHRGHQRTEQFNPKQLNSPNFVSSFRYADHVYFLFREAAIEHINCGKTIYSRIGRVCLNDQGGAGSRHQQRFTSFVKARLNCSIPGDFPFHFDEIQAATHVLPSAYSTAAPLSATPNYQQPFAGGQSDLLYAVFTTPTNSIGGSAICAYRMQDVLAAFNGPFKAQLDSNSNWLPVPESRVPQSPRPGTCANDSKRLPEEHINFVKDTPLMDTVVEPVWSQPLVTMASINFRFTTIAVDAQVETQHVQGAPLMRTDLIFVATDDGRIFKLINTYHLQASSQTHRALGSLQSSPASPPPPPPSTQMASTAPAGGFSAKPVSQAQQAPVGGFKSEPVIDVSASTLVIEELHLFDARTPILSMLIHYPESYSGPPPAGKLVVLSGKQLKAVPLSRCERALSCQDCLALFDPYCAWDLERASCISVGRSQMPSRARDETLAGFASTDRQLLFNRATSRDFAQVSSLAPASTPGVWFPANSASSSWPPQAPNNHTLGWWMSCPTGDAGRPLPSQVGAPVRSLFSSHLQVPSRFDYQSGHHLSRTALVALPQMATMPAGPGNGRSSAAAASALKQQPVSECLTFCGGVYSIGGSGGATAGATIDPNLATCAEYFGVGGSSLLVQSASSNQNLYTSENLLFAVIICALLGLLLGLAFGFAIGKSGRSKSESSICSSTFDETNLYMASTGSHCHPVFAAAPLGHTTAARLAQHAAFNGGPNGYAMAASNGPQPMGLHAGAGGRNGQFDASQCLLLAASDHSSGIGSSTYANQQQQQQQQLLFQQHQQLKQSQQQQQGGSSASNSIRALPPLPSAGPPGSQPLINTSGHHQTTHLAHSQLTPSSQSSSQSNSSSTSATMVANEQQQQQYHLAQQLAKGKLATNHHQRSFTGSSVNSNEKLALQGAHQALPQGTNAGQQAANNKIYL